MARPVEFPRWTRDELAREAERSLRLFVSERLAEGTGPYADLFRLYESRVTDLFSETGDLASLVASSLVTEGRIDKDVLHIARYLAGPPISADDLDTLVFADTRADAPSAEERAASAARVIADALDPYRYPWLQEGRQATAAERRAAVRWTASLVAVERLRTNRRTEASRAQSAAVCGALESAGYERVAARKVDRIDRLDIGAFCGEALVAGAKADVCVRLRDGRLLAVECKVSNTRINSVKRLLRETGGKAKTWVESLGRTQVVAAAVVSGVFWVNTLWEAQEDYGIFVVFEHDLDRLVRFASAGG